MGLFTMLSSLSRSKSNVRPTATPYHAQCAGLDTAVVGLKRFISDYPVEVIIYAGGDNLRQYVYNNNDANGFTAGDNEFSLIDGGYGVFSSRMTLRRAVKLGGETVPELVEMSNWGFKFIGGGEE